MGVIDTKQSESQRDKSFATSIGDYNWYFWVDVQEDEQDNRACAMTKYN